MGEATLPNWVGDINKKDPTRRVFFVRSNVFDIHPERFVRGWFCFSGGHVHATRKILMGI